MAVVFSHSLSVGIVGLPNAGKSTIFNALTKSSVPAENYPFCTVDKNIGVVQIPELKLKKIAKIYNSKNIVYAGITFVDIAGLVKGAAKGKGLGNQFLAHIRETDAIMYVLRAFKSDKVVHVQEEINPVEDLKTLKAELVLKDLETVEKRIDEFKQKLKGFSNDELRQNLTVLEKVHSALNHGRAVKEMSLTNDEHNFVKDLFLLTDKPSFYVLNVNAGNNEAELNLWIRNLKNEIPTGEKESILTVDCKTEAELDELDEISRKEFIKGLKNYHGVYDIIEVASKKLDLITFFTVNENEAHAWAVKNGITAKEAAGVVHTDFEKKFVTAEVINIDELIRLNGWLNAREKGSIRTEGKDYMVKDGDCLHFLANR